MVNVCHLKKGNEVTHKRDFYMSGDISTQEIREKAKNQGVTVHEYFMSAVSVASYKVTKGLGEDQRLSLVMPISVGGTPMSTKLDQFKPGNYLCPCFMSIPLRPMMSWTVYSEA